MKTGGGGFTHTHTHTQMGAAGSKPNDNFAVHELAPDTLLFMPSKMAADPSTTKQKPYIISKRSSPFVQYCLLAESLLTTRDNLVKTYVPHRVVPRRSYTSDDSDSDSDDGAGMFDFGLLGDDSNAPADPERGELPLYNTDDRMRKEGLDHATPVGGNAVEAGASTEIGTGIRNRTHSPIRDETWSIDLSGAPAVEPAPPREAARPTRPFGDPNFSKVAKMLPMMNGNDSVGERERYCRIDHVELWSAYSVFMTYKKEDAGLIRAVRSGAVDLMLSSSEMDDRVDITRRRVDDWRAGYAEDLIVYNTTVDVFVAKAGVYLAMAGAQGDHKAAALAEMAEAVSKASSALLPPRRGGADSVGEDP